MKGLQAQEFWILSDTIRVLFLNKLSKMVTDKLTKW